MQPNIVHIDVLQNQGVAPSNFLSKQVIISCGGSNIKPGSPPVYFSAPPQKDKNGNWIVQQAAPITGFALAAGVVTATCVHGQILAKTSKSLVKSVGNPAINGLFDCTYATASTFTFAFTGNMVQNDTGTYESREAWTLRTMIQTNQEQSNSIGFYLLELGKSDSAQTEVTAFKNWLGDGRPYFSYCCYDFWANVQDFQDLVTTYAALNKLGKFFFNPGTKDVATLFLPNKALILTDCLPSFQTRSNPSAGMMQFISRPWTAISQANVTNLRSMIGVANQAATFTSQDVADHATVFWNYIGDGLNGGDAYGKRVQLGVCADGKPTMYWQSEAWTKVNVQLAVNALILSSADNDSSPLLYNQMGINKLVFAIESVLNTGSECGAYTGKPKVKAISFSDYVKEFPNDFTIGKYAGITVTICPAKGFTEIDIVLVVNNLPT